MKRDMDLIRLILLEVEGEQTVDLSAYSQETINYHKALLINSGLCRGAVIADGQGNPVDAHIITMEWEGHDFLDAAKDKEIWEKVKKKLMSAGGGFTIGIILELLKAELKKKLGI